MSGGDAGRGYGIALLSALLLSTTAIFIRYLTETFHIPALVLAFWREGFVALTLLPFFLLVRPSLIKIERRHLSYLAIYGFMLAVFNSIWTISVALNGAAVSTLLVYSSAAFTAILGRLLLDEMLGVAKVAAVALSLAGCALVSGATDPAAWHSNLAGIATGIVSGLGYAIYSLMGRSASLRGLNPWATIFHTFWIAAICLGLTNLLNGGAVPGAAAVPADLFWLGGSWRGWGALLLLALGPTTAGYGLYVVSLGYLPSSVVNLVATSEVVFTALLAYLLLGERLSTLQVGGSLLIVAGVVLLRVSEGRGTKRGCPEGD